MEKEADGRGDARAPRMEIPRDRGNDNNPPSAFSFISLYYHIIKKIPVKCY